MGLFSFFPKDKKETLDKGLEKTKTSIFSKISRAIAGKSKVDEEVFDNLEEILISSDVGVETTLKIIKRIEERVSKDKYLGTNELNKILKDEIAFLLEENNNTDAVEFTVPKVNGPFVIMVVGVNGVGKTTTIGKLAHQFQKQGKKVILGAADTFRAAAVEQLIIWSQRAKVEIVQQGMNADPAAVAFDTLKFVEKLESGGFTHQQAKAAAQAFVDATGEQLVTKADLKDELSPIKADIAILKWMCGFTLAAVMAIFYLLLKQH